MYVFYFMIPVHRVLRDNQRSVPRILERDQKKGSCKSRGCGYIHTSNGYGLVCLVPSSQEDDILLRSVDVVIFEEEDFIDSIVL